MRKATLIASLLLGGILASFPVHAQQAETAEQQTCKFAVSLGEGTDAIIDALNDLSAKWNESDRAKLDPIFRPQLSKFELESGVAYRVADFPPFMQEYLVVTASLKTAQPIFFRLKFGADAQGFVFRNINFNTDFEEIFEVGTISEPVRIICAN